MSDHRAKTVTANTLANRAQFSRVRPRSAVDPAPTQVADPARRGVAAREQMNGNQMRQETGHMWPMPPKVVRTQAEIRPTPVDVGLNGPKALRERRGGPTVALSRL